ncbi:MAG: S8 family serine peptidase [Candidatus Magasanikbacteria bacterium]|nr:S8 family serine peptidase [Candidatus Magasanikbacteria bacterium]
MTELIKKRIIFFLTFFILSLFFGLLKPVQAFFPNDEYVEQWAYSDTKVYEAWNYATGTEDVVVAIIDNGFDTFHPDIRENAWKNEDEIEYNGIDDDANGYIDDVWGWNFVNDNNIPRPNVSRLTDEERQRGVFNHATAIAGIIGAAGNNAKDGVGLNWKVKLMNLKALGNSGSGDMSKVYEAIIYAVDNGADIINISVVGYAAEELKQAIKYAYDNNVLVFAAAGNEDIFFENILRYPVCADLGEDEQWVIGVSAVDSRHFIAPFSNYGAGCIDITAPGVDIASTLRYSPTNGLSERFGGSWSGTSFAVPFVSGAAALVKSVQPDWGPKQIYNVLLNSVHHTPGQNEEAYAHLFGAGLLQIDTAVKTALGENLYSHSIKSISLFNSLESNLVKIDGFASPVINEKTPDLSNIYDMDVFRNDNGKLGYVTIERHKKGLAKVNIYDNNWVLIDSWLTESWGRMTIKVANVAVENGDEIIISPKFFDNEVFRVLNFSGQEIGSYELLGSHRGVSLSFIDTDNSLQHILVKYRFDDLVRFEEFNYSFEKINSIDLPFLKDNGSIDSGDIDGDGEQEIVVSASEGDAPFIAYYERDGTMIKRFFSYDLSVRGGVQIVVSDVNNDGKDDILSINRTGRDEVIKVWDEEGKKIDELNFTYEGTTPIWKILISKQ